MRKLTMLLFSLLAFVGVVRAENVAKIGDVGYATLQDAIDAAILLSGDVEIEISAGTYAVDINLTNDAVTTGDVNARPNITFKPAAGADVTLAGTTTLGYRIQNVGASMWQGEVIFEGIKFNHAENGKHSLDIQDIKGITLLNCTITGDGEYGIGSNGSNATPKAAFTNCTFENGAMQVLGQLSANLVIDGCTFDEFSVNAQGGAKPGLTIKNSTFNLTLTDAHVGESFYAVRSNANPINIQNTKVTVDSELSSVAADQTKWGLFWARKDGKDVQWNVASCEVNLTDAAMVQTELPLTKNDGTANAFQRIILTDLTSTSNNVADLIKRTEGCATVNGINYKDGERDFTGLVAKIGDEYYATLAEAVAAAQNGETITLIGNVELAEVVTIPADKTLTIDLNGKSISMQESIIATAYAINNLGNLTIKDGVGGGSVNARGMYNGYGNGGDNVASAKLTINGGTFNAKGTNGGAAIFNYGIAEVNAGTFTSIGGYSLNNQAGSTMTIAAGVSANNGVYNSNATLTIDGGEISGNRSGCHVIYAWNSTIAINGGTLHNNNSGNATIMSAGTSVVTINGGTISINDGRVPGDNNTWTSCLTDVANTAQIIVNGGTFNGGFRVQAGTSMTINGGSFNDVYGSNYNINGTVTVTGGTFTDDASKNFASTYLAEGYMVAENNGVYTVTQAVAKIGETCYATLEDAFKAATSGCTIDLKKDITVAKSISINKLVTIDLNGKAISSAEGYVFEVTGGELVLQGVGSIGAICYIINDADYKAADKTFTLTENKIMVDIVYNRTFGHTSWQVLYVPFAIPVENMEGFEVYSISNVTDSGVVIEQVVEGALSANTPYIIKAAEAGDKTIKVTDATLSVPVAYEKTYGNFTINGTYSSMAIDTESQYVLTNGLWCQLSQTAVDSNKNILGAFRVYLTANGENTTSVVRFVINNSDATAIDELKAENGNVKAEVYDLSGRRVEKAVKGIYVVNGVKVIK